MTFSQCETRRDDSFFFLVLEVVCGGGLSTYTTKYDAISNLFIVQLSDGFGRERLVWVWSMSRHLNWNNYKPHKPHSHIHVADSSRTFGQISCNIISGNLWADYVTEFELRTFKVESSAGSARLGRFWWGLGIIHERSYENIDKL